MSVPKLKTNPTKNKIKIWILHKIFESDRIENSCQEIKITTIQESVVKNTKIPEIPKQKPRELAYRMNEMQVQKLEKGIVIGDSSHMISDMTGLYNPQKISGSVMIGNGQNIRCTHKGLLDVICVQKWEINVVPQLNHDLFSFSSTMKSGWQRMEDGKRMVLRLNC